MPHTRGTTVADADGMKIIVALAIVAVPVFAAAQTPPPTTPPPVPLGVNGQLASWFQVRGEFRTRIEGFSGGGFAENEDAYWINSFRLNAMVRPSKSLAFVIQAQDSRAIRKTAGSQAALFRDTLDVRLAYGEICSSNTVQIGRQNWRLAAAVARRSRLGYHGPKSFDGARATIKGKLGQVDAFAASVVTIDPTSFDKSGTATSFPGATSRSPPPAGASHRTIFLLATVAKRDRRTRRCRALIGHERRAHGGKGALDIGLLR